MDATASHERINEDILHTKNGGPSNKRSLLPTTVNRKKPRALKIDRRIPHRHHLNRSVDVEKKTSFPFSKAQSDSTGCLLSVAVGRTDDMGAEAVVTINSNGADPERGVDGRILSIEGHTAIHRLGQSFHAYKEVTGLDRLQEGEPLKTWADKIKGASMLIHIASPQLRDAENPTVEDKLALFRAYSSIIRAAAEEEANELALSILGLTPTSSPSTRAILQMAALHAVLSCSPSRIRCILICVPTVDDATAFNNMIRGLNYLPIADDNMAIRLRSILCDGHLETPADLCCHWPYRKIITIDADIIRIVDDEDVKEEASRDHDPLPSTQSSLLDPIVTCPSLLPIPQASPSAALPDSIESVAKPPADTPPPDQTLLPIGLSNGAVLEPAENTHQPESLPSPQSNLLDETVTLLPITTPTVLPDAIESVAEPPTNTPDEHSTSPSIVEMQPDSSQGSETIEQAESSEVEENTVKEESAVNDAEELVAESSRDSSSPNENASEDAEKIDDEPIEVNDTVNHPKAEIQLDQSPRKRGRPKKDASVPPPEPEKKKKKVKQFEDPLLVSTRWSTRLVQKMKK